MVNAALAVGLAFLATAGPVASGPEAVTVRTTTPQAARAVTTVDATHAFTYQGMLKSAGAPLNAVAELQFTLYDDATAGNNFGTQTLTTSVSNGLFTVTLNDANQFGAQTFDGRALWLEIAVRSPAGAGVYTTLTPRQALTAAPIAASLAPLSRILTTNTNMYTPALYVLSTPATPSGSAYGIHAVAEEAGFYTSFYASTAIQGDSYEGHGVAGSTGTGDAIFGYAPFGGLAGNFVGNVNIAGQLVVDRWQPWIAINSTGPLPLTSASFQTHGGTLMLNYSGSGYTNVGGTQIGMTVTLDGITFVDNTGIVANSAGQHLAFVPKTWVLKNIPAGTHTIGLTKLNNNTQTDSGDIFNVTITELPF